jgi:sulfur relay (sulfurtransferase) DsrF/TusC family protein
MKEPIDNEQGSSKKAEGRRTARWRMGCPFPHSRLLPSSFCLLLALATLLVSASDGASQTCTYALSTTNRTHGYGAATNMVGVTTSNTCAWSVINTNGWISILSSTSGTGSATVTYAVTANPSQTERTGTVMIADVPFTLRQQGIACSYSISPASRMHGYGQATNTVSVMTGDGCAWAAVNTNSWIMILSGTNGTGSATVIYAVAANTNLSDRTGVVLIGGQAFNLIQHGISCSVSISPVSRNHGYGAASNSVNVTTGAGCSWAVANTNSWITITSNTNGTGNATVGYTVDPNPGILARTGVVMIDDEAFTVMQAGVPCAFSISPTNAVHGFGSETGLVTVTATTGCNWGATNTNAWITITSSTSGTGSGSITYMVAANPSTNARTGLVTIADTLFTVSQAGLSCTYRLSPTNRTHGYAAVTNAVSMMVNDGCTWSVANTNPWIAILSGASGTGNGTVTYAVAANTNFTDRMGVVLIGGQVFNLTQHGITCTVTISPASRMHGYGATSNSVSVTTGAGCSWPVVNTNSWITITSGTNGTGNGTVTYTVAANPSAVARMGVVGIDGESFMISQAGAPCTYAISPTSAMHGFGSETGLVSVTAISGCAWTVSNASPWITIISGTNGTGNGSVTYTVATNAGGSRMGIVMIAGEVFTVNQSGSECTYKLSPTNRTHGYGASGGTVSMTTANNCTWSVVNTSSWITITSDTNATGSANVGYTVEANPNPSARTGLVMIADQVFTLSQQATVCTYKLSPTNRVHGFAAATNSVSVTAGSGCSWTVFTTNDWITINSSTNGMGNGSVSYAVNANLGLTDRTGMVMISDQILTLTQRGTTNGFSFDAISLLNGSQVRLRLVGAPAGVWELQASSNLVHWARISNLTNVTGLVEYIDTNPINLNPRFYRVVLP